MTSPPPTETAHLAPPPRRPDPGSCRAVHLHLLCRPALRLADGQEHPLAPKDALLLALLAQDGTGARAQLAAWLWPDTPGNQARTNLRQRLLRLRRTAGRELTSGTTELTLAPGVTSDWRDPVPSLRADPDGLRGDWLGALTFPGLPELEEWLSLARQRWHNRCQIALAACADHAEQHGNAASALPYARRLCVEEPLHEGHHRRLMRLHLHQSERAAALAVYDALRWRLQVELGVTPHPDTEALARQIGSARVDASPTGRPNHHRSPHPRCFDGTAVPVQRLFDVLQTGQASLDDFLQAFPAVSRQRAVAVLQDARARLLGMAA